MSETEPTREELERKLVKVDGLIFCGPSPDCEAELQREQQIYRLALEALDRRAELATLTDYRAIYERVAAAIGDDRYLDPPDGGSVDVDEQVRRMRVERDRLTAQVAEQAQEIAAKETMIAATDAEAAKALLLLTDAEAKLREQAQEIERLRREWEDAVERERRLAPSLADTQVMARDAQAKLRAVEALTQALVNRLTEWTIENHDEACKPEPCSPECSSYGHDSNWCSACGWSLEQREVREIVLEVLTDPALTAILTEAQ